MSVLITDRSQGPGGDGTMLRRHWEQARNTFACGDGTDWNSANGEHYHENFPGPDCPTPGPQRERNMAATVVIGSPAALPQLAGGCE